VSQTGVRWGRSFPTGILVSLLVAGCSVWEQPLPVPPGLTEASVQTRLRVAADRNESLVKPIVERSERQDQPEAAPDKSSQSQSQAFSLADAIALAQHKTPVCGRPRLLSSARKG
jgi:hypothetical protein